LNENKKEKRESGKKIAIRVVCFVLALTMVASTLFYILSYLFAALGA
jgi:hypothetical protein